MSKVDFTPKYLDNSAVFWSRGGRKLVTIEVNYD